jgi:hypothetical protein
VVVGGGYDGSGVVVVVVVTTAGEVWGGGVVAASAAAVAGASRGLFFSKIFVVCFLAHDEAASTKPFAIVVPISCFFPLWVVVSLKTHDKGLHRAPNKKHTTKPWLSCNIFLKKLSCSLCRAHRGITHDKEFAVRFWTSSCVWGT